MIRRHCDGTVTGVWDWCGIHKLEGYHLRRRSVPVRHSDEQTNPQFCGFGAGLENQKLYMCSAPNA
jgi:hypothetical protein